ncbi:Transcription factor mbp1 (MBF subunit p120), partial [Neurospora sp. IMI 360204]
MVKANVGGNPEPGIYSATYSGIPVWEYQFGLDLKEHVMRRRHDDWVNATHILKAAGFDKPARTRILEREVQKDTHEKIQGGYGRYQGTWIPLEQAEALARRNNIYERLKPIFEFQPGNESPPPAPRHASKPKAPRVKPAVPTWGTKLAKKPNPSQPVPAGRKALPVQAQDYNDADTHMHDDDTPDNLTVASASYMAEDDRHHHSHFSTGHRKRKRDDLIEDMTEQQHAVYGDELLDYFLLSRNEQPAVRPDPPPNFKPDWPIDNERHTCLHWASAMGDVDVVRQLKKFGASLDAQNVRGETPFMRAVNFTNCFEKQTFSQVMKELFSTIDCRDLSGCTVIHHAAVMKSGRANSQSCSRYYLDIILNRLQETHNPEFIQQLLDAQDNEGNTAVHLAAMRDARKCIRALLGRGASTDIPNKQGIRAEELIKELNASISKSRSNLPQRSSSPFAPDTQRHDAFHEAISESMATSRKNSQQNYSSDAANTVQNRITPLILQKLKDLTASYDSEFKEKDEAEKEARRILNKTQSELKALTASIDDYNSRLDSDDVAAKTAAEMATARHKVLAFVTHQNRISVQEAVQQELAALNGSVTNGTVKSSKSSPSKKPKLSPSAADQKDKPPKDENETESEAEQSQHPDQPPAAKQQGAPSSQDTEVADQNQDQEEDDYTHRLSLAAELRSILQEQRSAENDYVEARGMLGTGERIDKYKHLLMSCLPPDDQENLEENLEEMIKLMEQEDESVTDLPAGAVGGGAAAD